VRGPEPQVQVLLAALQIRPMSVGQWVRGPQGEPWDWVEIWGGKVDRRRTTQGRINKGLG